MSFIKTRERLSLINKHEIEIVDYRPGDYDKLIAIWQKAGLSYKPDGRDSREKIEAEISLNCNRFMMGARDG